MPRFSQALLANRSESCLSPPTGFGWDLPTIGRVQHSDARRIAAAAH